MSAPRWWDGRVRQVVSVDRRGRPGAPGFCRVELLACGHEKVPDIQNVGHLMQGPQFWVCFDCPGVAP